MLAGEWFAQAIKLEPGRRLLIRVKDKKEQTMFLQELELMKRKFADAFPEKAAMLSFERSNKGLNYWVVLEKSTPVSMQGFVRDMNGVLVEVIDLSKSPERSRLIRLMIKDGYTPREIEAAGFVLDDDELKVYFG